MSATTISSYPTAVTFAPNAALPAISYTLPASLFSSAQTAVQLTLNLCSAPEGYNQSQVDILTAFTNDTWTYGSRLYGGFGNITVPVISPDEHVSGSVSNGDLVIHLDTQTPSGRGRPEDWTFELGIAQVDTPWHTLDKLPLFAFEDADNVTALLTSPTYSAARSDAQPAYTPLLALSSDVRNDLANSSCYIRSLPQIGGRNITSSTTRRGVVELDIAEGGQVNETEALGRKVQYAISGLETGSNYTVWGIQPRDGQTVDGSARLFSRQFLATKRNANCRLLFDVPFCPDVAYSVPAPPALDTGALLDLYNASIAPHIEGFNLTLSTFTCGGPMRSEQGMYSRVRTCSQCLEAYRSWLCAIRMPRCVDYRTGAAAQAPTLEEEKRQDDDDDDDSGASRIYTYQHASANTSRTEFLPDAAFPYSELPPCIDVCHLVAASCPPPISASWQCPAQAVTLPQSYSRPFTLQEPDDDKLLAWGQAVAQGGDDQRYLQAALEKDGQATRAKDRWGNVICNDMGVIALTQRRRWSGSAIKNAAMGRWQQLDFRIALLPLLWTLFSLCAQR